MVGHRYGSVDAFVREFVCATFTRPIGSEHGRFWDAEWWRHPEAVLRLEALWHSWEAAQGDPGGMSAWLRDHADYHLGMLMAADGPFAGASIVRRPVNPCRTQHRRRGCSPTAAWGSPPSEHSTLGEGACAADCFQQRGGSFSAGSGWSGRATAALVGWIPPLSVAGRGEHRSGWL